MIIPPEDLAPDTLRALIEEFITRHGAVQGHTDTPLDSMIAQVLAQLRTGRAVIVFDEKEETASIVTKQELHNAPPDTRTIEEESMSRDEDDL